MDVAGRQEFPAARFQPAVARVGLALRTMPVAARVEGDGAMPAPGALIDVPAERGRPAADDGGQDLQVQPGEPTSGCARRTPCPRRGSGRPPPAAAGTSTWRRTVPGPMRRSTTSPAD